MEDRTIIKIEIPKVIWDAEMSIFNFKPILKTWMESVQDAVNKNGAKYQAERMYSEDDLVRFMQFITSQESLQNTSSVSETTAMYYIEQFKKK